jgi:hypothetical protein
MQEKIDELREKINSSAGYRAMSQLELLSLNFHVFDSNYKQWNNYIVSLNNPRVFMQLWDDDSRKESNLVIAEITRLLLNFLASATSLVAVTRNTVPVWYKDTKFAKEYEEKKDQIKSDNMAKFVEGLRNYAQHYRLPFVRAGYDINVQEKNITMHFVLDREVLLQGDWKEKGKDFLLESGKEIEIKNVVYGYYNKILEFHQWIFSSIQEINSEEIQNTSAMQAELEKLQREISES